MHPNPINAVDMLGLEEVDQPWPPSEPGEGKEGDWTDIAKALWKWFEQNHKQDVEGVKDKAKEWAKDHKAATCCIGVAGGTCYLIAQKGLQDKIEIKIPDGWVKINGATITAEACKDYGEDKCEVKFQIKWKF